MASPNFSILYSAKVDGAASAGAMADVLIPDSTSGLYVKSTAAARGTRRSTGIALSSYVADGTVQILQFGEVDAATAGLGTGSASWVRVSATGTLERASVSGSDDVCGYVETSGVFHACFGFLTADMVNGGGGGTVPTGTGFTHITAGAQDAAAKLVENADVHASAAIALSKIVNPTGTGVVKATAGVINAATSLIANADVSASAAIALSKLVNPTGTGLVKATGGAIDAATSLLVNADVSASAAIALSKIVNPTGTGLVKTSAGAIAAASALLLNADVDAAAAIAGTKISPNFGAQAVTTTGIVTGQSFVTSGRQTSSSTGTINNFSLTAGVAELYMTGAAPTMTGLTGGASGRSIRIIAAGGNIIFNSEDAGSTAANQFKLPLATMEIYQYTWVEFLYDATLSRWLPNIAWAAA